MVKAIYPMKEGTVWSFDEPMLGIFREPFVGDTNRIIDNLVKDIPNAESGFKLEFSDEMFEGFQTSLMWRAEEMGGNWYHDSKSNKTGWLCSVLYTFFDKAPKVICAKATEVNRGTKLVLAKIREQSYKKLINLNHIPEEMLQ